MKSVSSFKRNEIGRAIMTSFSLFQLLFVTLFALAAADPAAEPSADADANPGYLAYSGVSPYYYGGLYYGGLYNNYYYAHGVG